VSVDHGCIACITAVIVAARMPSGVRDLRLKARYIAAMVSRAENMGCMVAKDYGL